MSDTKKVKRFTPDESKYLMAYALNHQDNLAEAFRDIAAQLNRSVSTVSTRYYYVTKKVIIKKKEGNLTKEDKLTLGITDKQLGILLMCEGRIVKNRKIIKDPKHREIFSTPIESSILDKLKSTILKILKRY